MYDDNNDINTIDPDSSIDFLSDKTPPHRMDKSRILKIRKEDDTNCVWMGMVAPHVLGSIPGGEAEAEVTIHSEKWGEGNYRYLNPPPNLNIATSIQIGTLH